MKHVSVVINGKAVSVPQNSTILDAAEAVGVRIPTLCYLKGKNAIANCRICLVDVKGQGTFQPSCATMVYEGMEVQTDTEAVREARKLSLELILSSHSWDCHHCLRIGNYEVAELEKELCDFCFFCDCVKDGNCELQALAEEYNVNRLPFDWAGDPYPLDDSTGALVRNPNKCIKCRRCISACTNEQTANALGLQDRGSRLQVVPTMGKSLQDSPCVVCGKCIEVCPTGAIYAKEQYDEMLYDIRLDGTKTSVALISRALRPELARLLGLEPEELDYGKLATGLHKIGIDYVVTDEDAAAKAQSIAVEKLTDALDTQPGTLILSDRGPVIRFLKQEFSDLADRLVTYPSTEQQFGADAKGQWAKSKGLEPEDLYTITLSGDCSCKSEAMEPGSTVNFALTPTEVSRMMNKTAMGLELLPAEDCTVLYPQRPQVALAWKPLFEQECTETAEVRLELNGKPVQAAVAGSLGGARKLLDQVRANASPYRVIRI